MEKDKLITLLDKKHSFFVKTLAQYVDTGKIDLSYKFEIQDTYELVSENFDKEILNRFSNGVRVSAKALGDKGDFIYYTTIFQRYITQIFVLMKKVERMDDSKNESITTFDSSNSTSTIIQVNGNHNNIAYHGSININDKIDKVIEAFKILGIPEQNINNFAESIKGTDEKTIVDKFNTWIVGLTGAAGLLEKIPEIIKTFKSFFP